MSRGGGHGDACWSDWYRCVKKKKEKKKKKQKKKRAVVGQRSSPAGYILYCNIFIIKKIKMK